MANIKRYKDCSRKLKRQKNYSSLSFTTEECHYIFKLGIILGVILGVLSVAVLVVLIKIILALTV